jgi:pantoate--beta-alanine ligase
MGALHEGHLQLIRQARKENEVVIASIYVNPTQFNNPSDLEKYPRNLLADLEMLRLEKVDVVFTPEDAEMYPKQVKLSFDFFELERVLEGAFRPGHFNGVAIVVSKLFHIVQPNRAYFGQKDLQQVSIIHQLVEDLSFDIEIRTVPTVRESDGLAMSSRNLRLDEEQRLVAPALYENLTIAKTELLNGKSWFETKHRRQQALNQVAIVQLEYLELIDLDGFRIAEAYHPASKQAICIAAYLGEVRLIDNILLG